MSYRLLADAVFILHWLWSIVAILGLLPCLIPSERYRRYRKIFSIFVIVTLAGRIAWRGCPLTNLEVALRQRYDPSFASNGFVTSYVSRLIHYSTPPWIITAYWLAIFVVLIGPKLVKALKDNFFSGESA